MCTRGAVLAANRIGSRRCTACCRSRNSRRTIRFQRTQRSAFCNSADGAELRPAHLSLIGSVDEAGDIRLSKRERRRARARRDPDKTDRNPIPTSRHMFRKARPRCPRRHMAPPALTRAGHPRTISRHSAAASCTRRQQRRCEVARISSYNKPSPESSAASQRHTARSLQPWRWTGGVPASAQCARATLVRP